MTIAGPEFQIADKDQLYPGAQLEPNGLTFNEPVKAIVRPRGTDDLNNVSLLLASAPDQYEELDNIERNPGTGQVTGELDHFSWLYPFLVNPTPAGNPPSIPIQGGSDVGNAIFGQVGNGATGTISLRVTQSPAVLVWTDGTISSNTLVLQVNYPTTVANQVAHATLTMIDPGEYTGYGPNARQRWRFYVFNIIFQHMTSGLHISGPDGIAIYPTMANTIRWDQLPAGYPSGQVSAFIQYFDQNSVLIGTSTLVLSIART